MRCLCRRIAIYLVLVGLALATAGCRGDGMLSGFRPADVFAGPPGGQTEPELE